MKNLLLISMLALTPAIEADAFVGGTAQDALSDREIDALIKKFSRAFRSSPKRPRTLRERSEALATLDQLIALDIAKTLAKAYTQVEDEIDTLTSERDEQLETLTKMVKGQEFKDRTFPKPATAAFQTTRTNTEKLGEQITGLKQLQKEILQLLSKQDGDDSVAWLIKNVVQSKKQPLNLKLAVVTLAGSLDEPPVEELIDCLVKAKQPADLTVLMKGIAAIGEDAGDAARIIVPHLSHADPTVREQAAGALATLNRPEALEPLVARLDEEEDLTRKCMAAALETLTRMKLGTNSKSWKRWLAEDGRAFLNGDVPLGGGITALITSSLTLQTEAPRTGYYYGIPQEGQSIIYVIDCSGSMKASVKAPERKGNDYVDAGEDSRMEACKEALSKAIATLRPEHKFNIISFNDLPHTYEEKLIKATRGEIKRAQEWIQELKPSQSTNIHDSLERAFRFAGRGPIDKYYASAVDTIFLLTDGSPTTTTSKPDSTERIVEAVRRWNPYRRVTIHTIGLGKQINTAFLQQLASENNGQFVQH